MMLATTLCLLIQGADSPEGAIENMRKAAKAQQWDTVHEMFSPDSRKFMEKMFQETQQHPEKAEGIVTAEQLKAMTAKQFFTAFWKWLETEDPGHAMSKMFDGKITGKDKEGEGWIFHIEGKPDVPVVPVGKKWFIHAGNEKANRSANERNASATLKCIVMAEEDFLSRNPEGDTTNDYWVADVRGLSTLKDGEGNAIGLIEDDLAAADAAPNPRSPDFTKKPAAPKAGYRFAALKRYRDGAKPLPYDDGSGHHKSRYGFTAYPEAYGTTGKLTFILNEKGVIWKKDTQGKVPDEFPADPAKDGWVKVD